MIQIKFIPFVQFQLEEVKHIEIKMYIDTYLFFSQGAVAMGHGYYDDNAVDISRFGPLLRYREGSGNP